MTWTTFALLAPTASSLLLYVAVLVGFCLGRRPPRLTKKSGEPWPRVSILKPLAGGDDELGVNLGSFASIHYPDFELLLGVASLEDPAWLVARDFARAHPELSVKVLLTDSQAAPNPKVAQLIGLEREATGEVVVISDSNVRVESTYLWHLLERLQEPEVGLVSSMIVGKGERTIGAALENLQLATVVGPTVVASTTLLGRAITVGKSMAMWRSGLHELGGFGAVARVLAEDYALGEKFRQAGYRVVVSTAPVYNWNSDCSLLRTIERHTRWAKLRRSVTPLAFAFEPLLLPMVIALFTWTLYPCAASALAVGVVVVVQLAGAALYLRLARGVWPAPSWAALEVLRSCLVFFCWCRACVSLRVQWRGHDFQLQPGSAVVPIESRPTTRPRVA